MAKLTVTSPGIIFDNWWEKCCNYKDAEKACKTGIAKKPFVCRIVVARDIPPRHPYFSIIREMGAAPYIFDNIFQNKPESAFRKDESFMFGFPERHLSVSEQQEFTSALCKHRDAKKMKYVDIVTSSPLMISDHSKECISIISFPEGTTDEERYPEDNFGLPW